MTAACLVPLHDEQLTERQLAAAYRLILSWPQRAAQQADDTMQRDDEPPPEQPHDENEAAHA